MTLKLRGSFNRENIPGKRFGIGLKTATLFSPTLEELAWPIQFSHWQYHEEGHLPQNEKFRYLFIPLYIKAWELGVLTECWARLVGLPGSRLGPFGHDYNYFEVEAENYANQKRP